jgi:hypothetical protein
MKRTREVQEPCRQLDVFNRHLSSLPGTKKKKKKKGGGEKERKNRKKKPNNSLSNSSISDDDTLDSLHDGVSLKLKLPCEQSLQMSVRFARLRYQKRRRSVEV